MMHHSKALYKNSFTLIEMLIVIVIIGILATALIPRLQSVQARARDSKRKVDVRTIFNANEIYLTDNGRYAGSSFSGVMGDVVGNAEYNSFTGGQDRIPQITGVLNSVPKDPLNTCNGSATALCNTWYGASRWCTCNTAYGAYTYTYAGVTYNPNSYSLFALLENVADPDRCEVKLYGVGSAGTNTCIIYSGGAYPVASDTNVRKRLYIANPTFLQ